jgi:hypothetical protein
MPGIERLSGSRIVPVAQDIAQIEAATKARVEVFSPLIVDSYEDVETMLAYLSAGLSSHVNRLRNG